MAEATVDVNGKETESRADGSFRLIARKVDLYLRRGLRPVSDPAGGVTYQLASGKTADLSLPVLPAMKSHAPATPQAPFWYFDERDGLWKRNGSAVYDAAADAYVGTVDHLSTINTDIAKFDNAACLKVTGPRT